MGSCAIHPAYFYGEKNFYSVCLILAGDYHYDRLNEIKVLIVSVTNKYLQLANSKTGTIACGRNAFNKYFII